jgi:hypothetical protein
MSFVKRVPKSLLGSARFGKTLRYCREEPHHSRTAEHFYDTPFSSIVERNLNVTPSIAGRPSPTSGMLFRRTARISVDTAVSVA